MKNPDYRLGQINYFCVKNS